MGQRRYILHAIAETQHALWDRFLEEQAQSHLLQSWAWGELKATSGWRPLRVALWDTERGEPVAAAQILLRGAPRLPLRAGHLAYIPKGPLIDWKQVECCDAFFSQLHALLQRRGCIALRMEPNLECDSPDGLACSRYLDQHCFQRTQTIQPARSIVLDLAPGEEALMARMKEKWRYNVRVATRKGVTIRAAETIEDLHDWYTILQTTSERDHFGVHTFDYYVHAWRLLRNGDQARLLLALHEDQLLGGVFVALFAGEAIYLYGASGNQQRNLMPNYLLQWEAIRWAKEQGARSYDFWGIPDTDAEDEAMAGVYRFKRGWGGRVVSFLGCYERVYRPHLMRIAQRYVSIG